MAFRLSPDQLASERVLSILSLGKHCQGLKDCIVWLDTIDFEQLFSDHETDTCSELRRLDIRPYHSRPGQRTQSKEEAWIMAKKLCETMPKLEWFYIKNDFTGYLNDALTSILQNRRDSL